jgi:hypothetical protein
MEYFRFVLHIHDRQLVTLHVVSSGCCQDGWIREAAVISSTVRHSSTYQLNYGYSCNLFPTSSGAVVTKRDIVCFPWKRTSNLQISQQHYTCVLPKKLQVAFQNVHTVCITHLASCGYRDKAAGAWSWEETLRMRGVTSLYACMAWAGTTLPLRSGEDLGCG